MQQPLDLIQEVSMFLEKIHSEWGQWFQVEHVVYHEKNPLFEQLIFENALLGKVHVIDGVVQSTEKDEFIYQEMLAHVPLIAHGSATKVLIIGGGDGGILREVLKHPSIQNVQLCTIDPTEIEFSKRHLAHLSQGSFDHPKSTIHIDDGALFVKKCMERFDVILIDSSDPVGPCAALFTEEFYSDCKKLLHPGGLLVNMADVPFFQMETLRMVDAHLSAVFQDVTFFVAAAATYVGGFIALGFASDDPSLKNPSLETLENRFKGINGSLNYYNPKIHLAAFALPTFIQNGLKGKI